MDSSTAQLVFFLLFIITTAGIMTAGFRVGNNALAEAQIGQRSPYDVRVTRDFVFEEQNVSATDALREQVGRQVAPVYDWRETQREERLSAIRAAFSSMREAVASSFAPAPAPATLALEELPPGRLERRARKLRDEHFDAHLQIDLPEIHFDALARAGFAPALENALSNVVGDAMNNLIVEDLRELNDTREQGIYLRRMRDERVLIEYQVTDLGARLLDTSAVPLLLRDLGRRHTQELEDRELRVAILASASLLIQPNTIFNEALTQEKRTAAKRAVAEIVRRQELVAGQLVVGRNELITERHVRMYQAMISDEPALARAQTILGLILLILSLIIVLYAFGYQHIPDFGLASKDVAFAGVTLLLFLTFARLGKSLSFLLAEQVSRLNMEAWTFLLPMAGAGMLVRLVLRSQHAIVFSTVFSVLVGLIMDSSLFYATYTLVGCLVGAASLSKVGDRLALTRAGRNVGIVNVAMVLAYTLYQGEVLEFATLPLLAVAFSGGFVAGLVVSAILPVFESTFRYTTDIKLLELSNLNHPVLRDLLVKAPGSYHHSVMVASLCESAAEAIGCNPLLARVGSYYHDIGKMAKPGYFAENQARSENPHDKLPPHMSARVIKAHVTEGLKLADEHRLPREIRDFIEQHHGTKLIAYFYHRAKQQEEELKSEVLEADYRYAGPKPQSRETAICLLADGIEAASRSMDQPTPDKLKGLVQNMINHAFTDGQLDECDLTLRDLNLIADAFMRTLKGIYHHRPKYPSDKKKKQAQETRDANREKRASGRTSEATAKGAAAPPAASLNGAKQDTKYPG
ncbi:MAG: HDIG domain-containing metalloprotein, partial [Myxococcota bacterium]